MREYWSRRKVPHSEPNLKMNSKTTSTVATMLFLAIFASMLNLSLCSKPWDVIIFSQHWPESVCDNWMQRGNGKSCRQYSKSIWTAHGIWPTKTGTNEPSDCDYNNRFNPKDVRSIEAELDLYWTPIQNNGAKTNFWSHEWNKHGTCGTSVHQLSTQNKYFSQGVEWAKKYNMMTILAAAGIKPGQEYTIQQLQRGIKQVLNKDVQISCYLNSQRKSTLLEIRLCFDKTLELVDCDGGRLTNCRSNQKILYPEAK